MSVAIKSVIGFLALVLILTAFTLETSAQTVTAFVDRHTIYLSETVQFTIKWTGPNPGTFINLGVLQKDFKVLGTSQSNRSIITKGRKILTTEWVTELAPKHPGKLEIPSIQVGPHQTPPITLTVLPPSRPGQHRDNQDGFL